MLIPNDLVKLLKETFNGSIRLVKVNMCGTEVEGFLQASFPQRGPGSGP